MEDGGYIHHLVLCKGWLWKRSNKSGGIAGNLQYRKRYFELSNIALTYQQNEKKTDVSVAECGCGGEEVIKCTFLHIHPSHLHSYSLSHYTPSPCDPTSFSFSSFLFLHLPFSFPSPFSLFPPSFPFHLSLPSFFRTPPLRTSLCTKGGQELPSSVDQGSGEAGRGCISPQAHVPSGGCPQPVHPNSIHTLTDLTVPSGICECVCVCVCVCVCACMHACMHARAFRNYPKVPLTTLPLFLVTVMYSSYPGCQ